MWYTRGSFHGSPLLMHATTRPDGDQAEDHNGNKFLIRRSTLQDAAACISFFNRFYKDDRTEAEWRWLFADWADCFTEPLHVVAEDGGRVVGMQAAMTMPFAHDGNVLPTIKPEDTLVDVRYWAKNVFPQMFEALEPDFARLGIFVLWGFTPVPASFSKIGFAMPTKTRQLLRVFRGDASRWLRDGKKAPGGLRGATEATAGWLLARAANLAAATTRTFLPGLTLELQEEAPPGADDLSLRFSRQWKALSLHRTRDYLDWRLFRNPYVRPTVIGAFRNGRLIGYAAAALPAGKIAMLVDVIVADETLLETQTGIVVSALLAELEKRMIRMGARAMRGWSVTEHPFDQLVRRVAKRRGWLYLAKGNHVAVRVLPPYLSRFGALDINDWYITRLFTMGPLG
jgi:hypothetical protein